MKHITDALDKIATTLEEIGKEDLKKLAAQIDVVSNTLENTKEAAESKEATDSKEAAESKEAPDSKDAADETAADKQ